jgi:prepilin peptidase CpaA
MDLAQITAIVFVFAFTLVALFYDAWVRKIPNVLTMPAFAAGLLFHFVNGYRLDGLSGAGRDLRFALAGFAVGFGIVLILFVVGGSGGGDVKFMGALGCWLGSWMTFQVLVLSAIYAGAMTIVIVGSKVFQLKRLGGDRSSNRSRDTRRKKTDSAWHEPIRSKENWVVPFGVPAALAAWTMLALQMAGYGLPWPPIH